MLKLDPADKAKWVTALRSGKYKQTRNYLSIDGAYCCLGVACEVLGDGFYAPINNSSCRTKACGSALLPQEGDFINPRIFEVLACMWGDGDSVARHLSAMNDNQKLSFSEIADWIDENL